MKEPEISLTMSKSVYLELDDVISFKEFVISMRKGSLQNQIRKQAMDHYGDFPDLGTITVCKSDRVTQTGPLKLTVKDESGQYKY